MMAERPDAEEHQRRGRRALTEGDQVIRTRTVGMLTGAPTALWPTSTDTTETEEPIDPRIASDDAVQAAFDRLDKPQRALMYILLQNDGLDRTKADHERRKFWR